ncbi:NAD(P)H-dependent flavin oxidoreductase [Virgibacillus oceani]|uniref:Probable nitronate monooxygenase n=1 Tax=Virgibacillus oceani TaxID=1479511 RepID=A0A917H9I5_9BACI|nr:nitronate monooxygenase [Virgibacillus oceani]GGG71426.1 nitronate monooxygenase [Virgibacillus oceani]
MENLLDKLKVEIPIIQAGMAGGITTPELVAAVANTGALGTIGAGYMSAAALKKEIQQIKKLTDKPFAVNIFAANLETFSSDIADMQQVLNRFRDELVIDSGQDSIKVTDYLQEKIYVILEENIPIVSTAFGVLSSVLIKRLKDNNVTLIGMATNLDEASQLVDAGYDIIVAQGSEAGGHRGTFDVRKYKDGCSIGLIALVQDFLNEFDVPVVAAGGITSNKQVSALQSMGASAVQLGTRFLAAKEAGTNNAYRRALIKAGAEDTVITKVFSGRPARAIINRFIKETEISGVEPLPFPVQNQMTKDIRTAGKEFAIADFQSLWAGQGVGQISKEETAAEIVRDLAGNVGGDR